MKICALFMIFNAVDLDELTQIKSFGRDCGDWSDCTDYSDHTFTRWFNNIVLPVEFLEH